MVGQEDWQYHQDSRDEAVGTGCMGVAAFVVLVLVATIWYVVSHA